MSIRQGFAWGLPILIFGWGLISLSPQVVLASISLSAIVYLVWIRDVPPIGLVLVLYQWVQISIKPIYASISGLPLESLSERGAALGSAHIYASVMLVVLACGYRLGFGAGALNTSKKVLLSAQQFSSSEIKALFLLVYIFGSLLELLIPFSGGAAQIFIALAGLKFAGLFLLTLWVFANKRLFGFLLIFAVIEIGSGFLGYFADFRKPMILMFIATVCSIPRFRTGQMLQLSVLVVVVISFGVFWIGIKNDYRAFLNQGSGLQEITVPVSERAEFILNEALEYDVTEFSGHAEAFIGRISYIDFLADTMEFIPANKSHLGGRQTLQASTHVFTPRVLFPTKPILQNETILTSELTGVTFRNFDATSISVGYVGEFYADFGRFGGAIAILLYGALIGLVTRVIYNSVYVSPLIAVSFAVVPLCSVLMFETSLVKTVGGFLMAAIVTYFFQRFALHFLSRSFGVVIRNGSKF